MKHCLVTLAALMVAASSYAQGTLNFVNRITGVLDARVMYAGAGAVGGGTTADTQFVAQLYAAAPGGALTAVGAPIPFRNSGAGTGYWVGAAREVPVASPTDPTTTAQVRVWSTALGATYEDAMATGMGGVGQSAVLTIPAGTGLNPATPLTGLTGFDVSPIVPEPSMAALGLLGAGLLLIRRKK